MNTNRNLHSLHKLTEFAREFEEEESDSILSKFYTRFTNVVSYSMPIQEEVNESGGAVSLSVSPPQTQPEENEPSTSGGTTDSISNEDPSEKPDELPLDLPSSRTPLGVLTRISSLIAQKENNLSNYKDTELQKLWMPDSKAKECYECSQKFTTFRRRHHCRLCGQIFCSKCCNQVVPGKIIMCSGDLKVCTYCSKIVLSYLKSPDITADLKSDLQAFEDDLSTKLASPENTNRQRKVSFGYQEERLISSPKLTNADRKNILQQSSSLRLLYIEMTKALETHNSGHDLVAYLINAQKAANKEQAVAILSAFVEAGFLLQIVEAEAPPAESEIIAPFKENGLYQLLKIEAYEEADGKHRLRVPDEPPSTPTPDRNVYIAKEFELKDSIMSTVGSKPLLESFCDHEEALINQMLRNEGLNSSWSKILIPLCARAANSIRPESCGFDQMDIRHFVNFKKISADNANDSKLIGGVVFSKNVTHKDMPTRIEKPRILLLQCAIVYQRIEGKFVTLENLMLQEKEYLRNVTMRILNLGPNVVLVHKNVAGIAQEMLRSSGITLVLDVKISVLERLSRVLKCDIVTSIDSNIGRPKLGTCEFFYRKTFSDGKGMTKTLMFFETPYNPRGGCVLLKGAPTRELVKVKKVAQMMLFARYNWRLEMAFLLDEFARPPSPKRDIFDASRETSPCEGEDADKVKKAEARAPEKIGNLEDVQDCSDPLRSEVTPSQDVNLPFAVHEPFENRFKTALSSTVLSVSPNLPFPLPYLETEAGRKCTLRKRFPNELFYSKQWSTEKERPATADSAIDQKEIELLPPHPFIVAPVTVPVESKDFQDMLASFRARGGRYPKRANFKPIERDSIIVPPSPQRFIEQYVYKDALDIETHQRLPVLFYSYYSSPSPKAACSFCAQPSTLEMQFYGQNDIAFGLFLERYCFRSSYICPSCNLPMTDHIRRYVHSMGCVQVRLREDVKRGAGDANSGKIMMMSWCSICNELTPSVAISNDTLCLSYAKYLELRFHGHLYRRRYLDEQPVKKCKHSIHRDYIQYFSSNGITASFWYEPIEIWEVGLPVMIVQLKPMKSFNNLQVVEDIKNFAMKGYDVYAKIYDQLAENSSDTDTQLMASLKSILNRDQLIFRQRVEVVQTLLTESVPNAYDINDAMLMVKRVLAESIDLWGPRLNDPSLKHAASSAAVDNGTACTEELNPDAEREISVISLPSTDDDDGLENLQEPPPDKSPPLDKRSIRTLVTQLLPSTPGANILQSPIPSCEHHTLPLGLFPLLVHDQDLSSIIAYSLVSGEYKRGLEALNSGHTSEGNGSPVAKRKSHDNSTGGEADEREEKASKKATNDVTVQVADGVTTFSCKIYFPREFDGMRMNFLKAPTSETKEGDLDEIRGAFARSLCRSVRWEAQGGKSGSKFSKTIDDQFVLKEMSRLDIAIFQNFAPNYFDYIQQCLSMNKPTLLAKIFGVFKISVKKKDHVEEKAVLVMENLFRDREISNKYDLKGSERNRLVDPNSQRGKGDTVLMDENLIQMSWTKPLYILTHSHTVLKEALNRDSTFLERNGVMDYSLLVGLDAKEKLLILGIIDYIRTFTFDKRLESLAKQLYAQGKLPTVVHPKTYRTRFLDAMERYFLPVPDRWEGLMKGEFSQSVAKK